MIYLWKICNISKWNAACMFLCAARNVLSINIKLTRDWVLPKLIITSHLILHLPSLLDKQFASLQLSPIWNILANCLIALFSWQWEWFTSAVAFFVDYLDAFRRAIVIGDLTSQAVEVSQESSESKDPMIIDFVQTAAMMQTISFAAGCAWPTSQNRITQLIIFTCECVTVKYLR